MNGEATQDATHQSAYLGSIRHLDFARSIARAVDVKCGYFPSHSEAVSYLAGQVAQELDWSSARIERLRLAAMLHDIGKIALPDEILLAPRPLLEQEKQLVDTHAAVGADIVASIGLTAEADWIHHHHEHWDGHGYPDGMRGQAIPIESRVILVADAFHVITTDRPYQRARPVRRAAEILEANERGEFCPEATAALLSRH